MQSANSMLSPNLLTALIAATGALVGVLLKDWIFKRLEEHRTLDRSREDVYLRYAQPLISASESLLWRLNESLRVPGRGRYLLLDGLPNPTNRYSTFGFYKKVSTLYRLAALLGWLQALRRELSQLKPRKGGTQARLEDAIRRFQAALADGPEVEIERVERLLELWRLGPIADSSELAALAVELEHGLGSHLQQVGKADLDQLEDDDKRTVVKFAADLLCSTLNKKPLSEATLASTTSQAFEDLAIKEAWIYRDWQAAIGDLMITSIEGRASERRFDVIGFSEFERICTDQHPEHVTWAQRLSSLIDRVNVAVEDRSDHRPKQLNQILMTTASLFLALMDSEDKESRTAKGKSIQLASQLTEAP